MAEYAAEQTLEIGDFLDAFKRRRLIIGLIAGLVFLPGLFAAYLWPPTYQSNATILIEEQEIPSELVQSTITSYAAQRIQVISQRVMTRTNLMEIIEKFNLYEDDLERKTTEEVIADMRNNIQIETINAEVMDPRTGRPGVATIAFSLGFQSNEADSAQKVASELTSLYLNENLRNRTEKATETYDFLSEEATRLNEEITALENQLAVFKEDHANSLPELQSLNLAAIERVERDIASIDTQLRTLQERRIYLQGQLALLKPYGSDPALSPETRLEALRTQYIGLIARYSADHPDVLRVKREIEGLERQTGLVDTSADQLRELDALRTELATTREKYSDEHPDVRKLNRQIAALEDSLKSSSAPSARPQIQKSPDNPAYVTLQSQLLSSSSEIKSLKQQREDLLKKLEDYEQRLMDMPQVEREYRNLVRDQENTIRRYQEIKAKQMQADVARELEKERKGERFTLIDPAITPEEPISPNRPAILFLSLVLAIGSGIGYGALAETMDKSIRGSKGITGLLQTAPLAVIPYLPSAAEKNKGRNYRLLAIGSVVGGVIIVILLVHFLVAPLDVLWFRFLRNSGIMALG